MPLTGKDGLPTQVWWRFWFGLFTRNQSTIPYLVETGIAAAGATQATATPLTAEWNEISTTPVNSGVVLDSFGQGFNSTIFNAGANALNVYPPVGCTIDVLAINAAYSLAAGKSQIFSQLSATSFRSQQLG